MEYLPLRAVLRQATNDVHARLHHHDGFSAIQSATIELDGYRTLLLRLYGFYVPFERAVGLGRDRTQWLEDDLGSVGLDLRGITVPMCANIPRLDNAGRRLGANYVVEGSALGGRGLAHDLDRLLGTGVTKGRRFFLGRGSGTAGAWHSYLEQLAEAPLEPAARTEIIAAATETFAVFEEWLNGWKTTPHG